MDQIGMGKEKERGKKEKKIGFMLISGGVSNWFRVCCLVTFLALNQSEGHWNGAQSMGR
jgi:hypothetical protein